MKTAVSIISAFAFLALARSACGAEDASLPANQIDFKHDIVPLLTKHGCNAGACHGAAIGRGGFKLSLYGGDPIADYAAIVRQLECRRVNLFRPGESLIVLKPAEYLEHGGGSVFDYDSESARLLINWIKRGAVDKSHRDLTRVEIMPRRHVAESIGETIPLRAIAHYSDGTTRDVTKWAIFTAEDSSSVEISDGSTYSGLDTSNSGQQIAKVVRRGRHIVVARYLSEVVPIEMIVPLTDSKVDLSAEPRNNFIDEEILVSLAMLGLSPAPIVDDAAFVRRLSLDLTGRLPVAVRALAQQEGDGSDHREQGKPRTTMNRPALIDLLLQSEEFNEYWTLQLAKLFRVRPLRQDKQGAQAYHRWLADQLRNDVSYKQMARTMILATGDSHENGPANFYRTVAGPRKQAELMSELFMGSRLRCANCHNHPLDHWTQDDYHGLAAIFAKVEGGKVVRAKPNGEVIHPRTGQPAVERIPGERFLEAAGATVDGREQLAEWLTDLENPYFAKAVVNRLWQRMMGRGLVEPADDFRATNPATHPALLDKLAEDFVANGYNLRHTLRVIANSATYARSADANRQNKDDNRFYSHAARRPLEPEVLADAISDVLGIADDYGDEPEGTRAVALVDPTTRSRTLDVLGRCDRQEACESSRARADGLPQKLHLFNGAMLNARISAEGSRLNQLLSAGKEPIEIVNEFYFAALNRIPSDQEREHWIRQLARMESAERQQAFLEDFVWGLVVCNEFVTNH